MNTVHLSDGGIMFRRVVVAACLVAACVSVPAQDYRDVRDMSRPLLGMPGMKLNATSPEALRDSLVFAARMKDSAWIRPVLPVRYVMDMRAFSPGAMNNISSMTTYESGGIRFAHNPYAFDYNTAGVLTSWGGGAVAGSGFRATMPALFSRSNASLGVVQSAGNFTFTAFASADRYLLWRGTRTVFGVSGSMNYRFNDNVSATMFGRYYDKNYYLGMAAMPYVGTSGYGGFVTFMGETVGIDVGVERYYDSFARRWVTSPIITPKIRFSDKFTLDLPVGWLVREAIDKAVHKGKYSNGPMIMPEGVPTPGQIPFGPPEMPH